MELEKTYIEDLVVITPKVFGDNRGYFIESYNADWFKKSVLTTDFVQDNESKSKRGVIRGLHFQAPPFDQAKLVRVVSGEVLDVAVDLRSESPTYGKVFTIKLSGENKKQLFIPRGFAHGFSVLSEEAVFAYKVDNTYNFDSEGGIIWNDETLSIDWGVDNSEAQISEKDKMLPTFKDFNNPF